MITCHEMSTCVFDKNLQCRSCFSTLFFSDTWVTLTGMLVNGDSPGMVLPSIGLQIPLVSVAFVIIRSSSQSHHRWPSQMTLTYDLPYFVYMCVKYMSSWSRLSIYTPSSFVFRVWYFLPNEKNLTLGSDCLVNILFKDLISLSLFYTGFLCHL